MRKTHSLVNNSKSHQCGRPHHACACVRRRKQAARRAACFLALPWCRVSNEIQSRPDSVPIRAKKKKKEAGLEMLLQDEFSGSCSSPQTQSRTSKPDEPQQQRRRWRQPSVRFGFRAGLEVGELEETQIWRWPSANGASPSTGAMPHRVKSPS